MRSSGELKQLLRKIRDNDYQLLNGIDLDNLLADMLRFIGHIDSELRDDLIYSTFYNWTTNETISLSQMRRLLNTCLDEQHLFFNIGEKDTDSVFTRTFSVLIVPLAFNMHEKNPFLTGEEILNIKKAVLRYVKEEKDSRGFVEGKGWAHAVAHSADAIESLVRVGNLFKKDLLDILDVIDKVISNNDYMYCYGEDERMVNAFISTVLTGFKRGILDEDDIGYWLNTLAAKENSWDKGPPPDRNNVHLNRKNFMRSLYFKSLRYNRLDNINKIVLDILQNRT